MTQFATPATSGGIDYKELKDRLLIVEVLEIVKDVNTTLGVKDAVRANVTVVDGDQPGTTFPDTLIFPKVLLGQLGPNVGKQVLGRLGQGVAKPGQNAPWTLAEASDDDIKVASEFLAQQAAGQLTADDI